METSVDTAAIRARTEVSATMWNVEKSEMLTLCDALDEARAEVERLRTEHTWPKTTPTGHTYVAPTTYDELRERHTDAAQAFVEWWSPSECPPEPTWEMVGLAHKEVDTARATIRKLLDMAVMADVIDEGYAAEVRRTLGEVQ
jgi:hypothetical protein